MSKRTWARRALSVMCVAALGACASNKQSTFTTDEDAGDAGGNPIVDDSAAPPIVGKDSGPSSSCTVTDPNADMDKDGWTPNQGDCNDCDPNVNPGAIDVLHTNDGGPPTWGDEDCSGVPGDSAQPCDTSLALASVDAMDGAKAIELCRKATAMDRKYGVISAAYVRSDGTPYPSPGLQVGIEPGWGTNVKTRAGASLLVLSSGHARAVGDPGACNSVSCITNQVATPPTGFPQNDPSCPIVNTIFDDVALELQIRVPTNATGYSFDFKFHSFEFPDYVCDTSGWNDEFVALVSPAPNGSYVPKGSQFGNISFDGAKHPVSVNIGFFDVCDASAPQRFAATCNNGMGPCPPLPKPYCPLGLTDLAGTGFDVWHKSVGPAGATRWLRSQAPATGGSTITVRFAIWDAGNAKFDSTVLIDDFQWLATPGVSVGTLPPPN
jgi:hypothetical protein